MKAHNPPRVYRLYLWRFNVPADSPQVGARIPKERGKCIGEFSHYKLLVAEAQRRAVAAGYPKSAWLDLFDWNV